MFQPFIYLSKCLSNFNFWVNTSYFISQFLFVATSILDVNQFVKLLWFLRLCCEILIVVLSLFFSAVTSAFQLFTRKLCLQFQDWGCVILREIDFLLKIFWLIPCLHPSWKVHTWIKICASLNHRKKMKAEPSRLIPRKHTEALVLLSAGYSLWHLLKLSHLTLKNSMRCVKNFCK